jgi:hypothetical protein
MTKNLTAIIVLAAVLMIPSANARMPYGWDHLKPIPNVWITPDDLEGNPSPVSPDDDTLNVRINSDNSGQLQNEQQVWINPYDQDNVVAVWRDFRFGYRRIGVGYSFDGGLTWTDELLPVGLLPWHSDPGLTYDLNGNFYAMTLSLNASSTSSGFEIFRSTNGGLSWEDPVWAIQSGSDVFEDKEMIACDRAPDSPYQGNLYISWTRFSDHNRRTDCCFIRSIDGNQNWDPPIIISDNPTLQWPLPVVGAGGTVYVAWVSYRYSQIRLDRSFDGGETWGDDIIVTNCYEPSTLLNGDIMVFSFPAMDADITGGRYHGNLYVAYMDKTNYDRDIYFRKSTDQGETWSNAVRINDDEWDNGCDQFHPWLTVDENGVLTAMFYDRRNDEQHNLLYDIYCTQSFDGGDSWTDNVRVTTESSDPTAGGTVLAGLIGEYSGVSLKNGWANFVWTDFRNNEQDTYGARIRTYVPTDIKDEEADLPRRALLVSNYPNPFNSATNIKFNLPVETNVEIKAYDVSGREVADIADTKLPAGNHSINWSPENLSSGIYFVRLETDNTVSARKVVFLK